MASIASALRARLWILSAMAILRRARYRIDGIAAKATMKPDHENASSCCVHRLQRAAIVT